jgi:hypothetical protein
VKQFFSKNFLSLFDLKNLAVILCKSLMINLLRFSVAPSELTFFYRHYYLPELRPFMMAMSMNGAFFTATRYRKISR